MSHIERQTLRPSIGRAGFFALAFGSMIGVGWVTALGGWLNAAGPMGAVLGFAAGGLLMVCIGLCYAELCAMLPVAGGEVAYAYKAFGTGKAYLVGWFLAFGYLSVSAFEAISVGTVLGHLIPGLDFWPLYHVGTATVSAGHLALAAIATLGITWINYRGVGGAALLQVVLTVAFLVAAASFIVAGLVGGETRHAEPWFANPGTYGALSGIAAVFVTAPFWFVGFDTIPQGAEEADSSIAPATLSRLMLVAIVGATVFYCVVIWSVAMVEPWRATAGASLPAAHAFEHAFGSPLLAKLVLIAALLGLLTSWNGFFLAGSRVLFALGRGHIAPPWLGATHAKFGTPKNAVLLSGAVTLAGAFLGRGAMVAFIDVGSFCIALAFLGVTFSATRLRKTAPDMARPYRMPLARPLTAVAGVGAILILGVMIVPGSGASLAWPLEWGLLVGVVLLGAILWWLGRAQRAETNDARRAHLVLGEYADK